MAITVRQGIIGLLVALAFLYCTELNLTAGAVLYVGTASFAGSLAGALVGGVVTLVNLSDAATLRKAIVGALCGAIIDLAFVHFGVYTNVAISGGRVIVGPATLVGIFVGAARSGDLPIHVPLLGTFSGAFFGAFFGAFVGDMTFVHSLVVAVILKSIAAVGIPISMNASIVGVAAALQHASILGVTATLVQALGHAVAALGWANVKTAIILIGAVAGAFGGVLVISCVVLHVCAREGENGTLDKPFLFTLPPQAPVTVKILVRVWTFLLSFRSSKYLFAVFVEVGNTLLGAFSGAFVGAICGIVVTVTENK